jgi:hypothetical protein
VGAQDIRHCGNGLSSELWDLELRGACIVRP